MSSSTSLCRTTRPPSREDVVSNSSSTISITADRDAWLVSAIAKTKAILFDKDEAGDFGQHSLPFETFTTCCETGKLDSHTASQTTLRRKLKNVNLRAEYSIHDLNVAEDLSQHGTNSFSSSRSRKQTWSSESRASSQTSAGAELALNSLRCLSAEVCRCTHHEMAACSGCAGCGEWYPLCHTHGGQKAALERRTHASSVCDGCEPLADHVDRKDLEEEASSEAVPADDVAWCEPSLTDAVNHGRLRCN